MKKKYLIILCILMFFVFLFMYLTDNINGIDDFFYKYIIKVKSNNITNIMKFITFFASTKFVIFLMIVFLIMSKKYRIFNIINLLVIGEVIINRIVKIIVRRDRPELINLVEESSFSFPSGHTMVAVTLYGFIIYLIYKSNLNNKLKYLLILSLLFLIILIIISRIYLGVHYFSDCIAGVFLALAYLIYSIDFIERKKIL